MIYFNKRTWIFFTLKVRKIAEIKALSVFIQGELDRVSQTLTGRIRQLAERYAEPLPFLEKELAQLSAVVNGHLKRMENAQ